MITHQLGQFMEVWKGLRELIQKGFPVRRQQAQLAATMARPLDPLRHRLRALELVIAFRSVAIHERLQPGFIDKDDARQGH